MTIRKKPSPISAHCGNEYIRGKENLKPQNLRKKQKAPQPFASYANEHYSSHEESLAVNLELNPAEHRTYCDPIEVQQWMTNSIPELDPLSEVSSYGLYNAAQGNNASVAPLAQGVPGSLSVSQVFASPISLQDSTFFPGPGRSLANYDDNCEPILAPGVNASFDFPQGLDFDNVQSMGEQHHNTWSYPTPVDDSFLFPTPGSVQSANVFDDPGLCPDWTSVPFPAGADVFTGTLPCETQPMAWPPVSAVDSSAASSYSHNSLFGYQPNSPLSPDIQEDSWATGQRENLDDVVGVYPALNIGEAPQFSCPLEVTEPRLNMSSLTTGPNLERQAVLNLDSWPNCDLSSQAFMTPPFTARRRPSEGETTTAREHHYYQAGPGADGMYHCPFAEAEDCTHKPEKLKCNYDKHLDSHLKPYRCKVSSCVSVPFSSTACLLRHEREAHGMHGHGEKPHLCRFSTCERSQPGNGFPRRWNLGDHMKRMHEYTGAYSTGSSSPSPSSTGSSYQGIPAKRRPSNSSQVEGTKRTKQATSTKVPSKATKSIAPSTTQRKQRQSMDKMFQEKKAAIAAGLENLDPKDARASEQITADYAVLQTIAMTIRRHEASQFAN